MLKLDGLQVGMHTHTICSCIILAAASLVAMAVAFVAIGDGDPMEEVDADDWTVWEGTNIKWKFDRTNEVLFIQPIDPDVDMEIGDDPPWKKLKNEKKCVHLCISDKVVRIGERCFFYFQYAQCLYIGDESTPIPSSGVVLPGRLQLIGGEAFKNCFSLSGALSFPDTLQHIGDHSFEGCGRIGGSLIIPDSVTYLGKYAFAGCKLDGDIIIGNGLTSIPEGFCGSSGSTGMLFIGARVETVEPYAFYKCKHITQIVTDAKFKNVGEKAFADCPEMAGTIDFSSMTAIGDYAFSNSGKITGKLPFSSALIGLGEGAFQGCAGLTGAPNVLTSAGSTEIKPNTFKGCSGLNGTIVIPETITKIGKSAFEGCSSLTGLKIGNTGVKGLVIDDYAFANCSSMRFEGDDGLVISEADYIGSHAFYNCSSLTGVLKVRAKEISGDGYNFAGCTGFRYVEVEPIPDIHYDPVMCTIPNHAFFNCTGLKEIRFAHVEQNTGFSVSEFAFAGCTGVTEPLQLVSSIWYIKSNAFADCTNILMIQCDSIPQEKCASDAFPSHVFHQGGKVISFNEVADKTTYSGSSPLSMDSRSRDASPRYVLFDADGGSEAPPVFGAMANGVKLTLPAYSGEKERMKFSGWSCNDTVYRPGDEISLQSNMNFTAVWIEQVLHDVTYDLDGGSGTVPQQHGYEGDRIILLPYDGTKASFNYRGWLYDGVLYQPTETITMPDGDITIVASWSSRPTHIVSYDIDGGSGNAPRSRELVEEAVFLLPNYKGVKAGHIFSGWLYGGVIYKAGDKIVMGDKDIAIIARWTPVHSVFYDIAGGTGDVPDTEVVPEGEVFVAAECTAYKEGFRFSGWSYGTEEYSPGDGIEMGIFDITLTAVWKRGNPAHSVFYDANGGSEDVPIQGDVEEGSSFTIKMYSGTKDGYVFGGWSYDGDVYDTGDRITMGTSDIMLTAVWNEEGSFLDGGAIMIICAAAAGIFAACAVAFYIVRLYRWNPDTREFSPESAARSWPWRCWSPS